MAVFMLAAVLVCTAWGKKKKESVQPPEVADGQDNTGETEGEPQVEGKES